MSDINISINMEALNVRSTALRNAGESFTEQPLVEVDTQSTLSIVQNSIHAHEVTNQKHVRVGEYLVALATQILDIGERFFEMDQNAASTMGIEAK